MTRWVTSRPRGRPRRQSSLHKFMRVSNGLEHILTSERKRKERFNDTILRIIMERGLLAKENYDKKGTIDYLTRIIDDQKDHIDDLKRIIENLQSKVKLQEVKIRR